MSNQQQNNQKGNPSASQTSYPYNPYGASAPNMADQNSIVQGQNGHPTVSQPTSYQNGGSLPPTANFPYGSSISIAQGQNGHQMAPQQPSYQNVYGSSAPLAPNVSAAVPLQGQNGYPVGMGLTQATTIPGYAAHSYGLPDGIYVATHPQQSTLGSDHTRVVGQQGRRQQLPSEPGHSPITSAMRTRLNPKKNDEGRFSCPGCTKTYLHAKHLKRHMLRHTNERPYTCPLCNDDFNRSDVLKRHFQNCARRRGYTGDMNHLHMSRSRHAHNHAQAQVQQPVQQPTYAQAQVQQQVQLPIHAQAKIQQPVQQSVLQGIQQPEQQSVQQPDHQPTSQGGEPKWNPNGYGYPTNGGGGPDGPSWS